MRGKILTFYLIFWVLLFVAAPSASTLRCDGRVIHEGNNKAKVLAHCGEPTWVDERQEERFSRHCRGTTDYPHTYQDFDEEHTYYYRQTPSGRHYQGCKEIVTIEEWFYNFGPNRFTQTLIFENNRLVNIVRGEYGY